MVPAACTGAMIRREGGQGGRSRLPVEKEEEKEVGGEARWRAGGKRGMRRLPSRELAFTKHQEWDLPEPRY